MARKKTDEETKADKKTQADRELVRIWKSRIEASEKWRDEIADRLWRPCLEAIKGNTVEKNKVVNILLMLAGVQTLRSSIYFKNPAITINPKKTDKEEDLAKPDYIPLKDRAKNMKRLITHLINEDNGVQTFKKEARKVLMDAIYSIGVFREIYQIDMRENPKAGQPMMTTIEGKEEPLIGRDGKPLLEPGRIGVAEHFRTVRVSPFLHLVDSMAKEDLVNATWVGEVQYIPLEDVKADKRYTNTEGLKASLEKGRGRKDLPSRNEEKIPEDPRTQLVKIIYIEDLKTQQILTFADGFDEMLHPPKPMPIGMEHGSYTYLQFINVDGDEFYGIPLAWLGIEPQKAYNQASNHIKKLRIHDVIKILVMKGAIDKNGMGKLESTEDNVAIPIKKGSVRPGDAVGIMGGAQPRPLDTYSLEKALSELNKLFGLTSERFGGTASAPTLGQSQLINQESDVKESERLDLFTDAVRGTLRKKMQRVRTTFLLPVTLEAAGADPPKVLTDKSEIDLEADLDIQPGSTIRKDPLVRRAMTNDAFTRLFGTNPGVVAQHFDDLEMAEILAEQNEWEDVLKKDEQIPFPGAAGAIISSNPDLAAPPESSNSFPNPEPFPPFRPQDVQQRLIQRQQAANPGLPAEITGVQR